MTSKKHKQAIADSLSSALEPPRSRRPSPALDGILSQYAPAPSPAAEEATTLPPPQATPPHPTPPYPTPTSEVAPASESGPAAPAKDFNRRANSLERDALPAGFFPGTSKKLYDALYLRTRGAVAPTRTVRAKKKEMMRWAGIGSENTMDSHLRHFLSVGLLKRTFESGDNSGAIYEVFIPEELGHPTSPHPTSGHRTAPQPTSDQNLPPGSPQNLGWGEVGKPAENTGSYDDKKTSFKTNTENDDDEAFAQFVARMRKAVRDLTGKEPSAADGARWGELAEFLDTELRIAAGRTGSVSNVPAFLTEHLRRRLWKKEKRQLEGEGKSAEPGQTRSKVDASNCPDCFGTGMWYPEGFEKGVARCGHDKLTKEG
ncbi:MAG: hypothetical protein M3348_08595 [Acidobacteriota bacterium]|nr:hypothetical protein [Acidobacteriota bacterium]